MCLGWVLTSVGPVYRSSPMYNHWYIGLGICGVYVNTSVAKVETYRFILRIVNDYFQVI